ncbi:MAG: response regulator transcription factor [Cyclobacteriaceae bacterium]|nr:response regulator transcription factor [Cyclobacteriaceae bacterium]
MTDKKYKILVVDDEAPILDLLRYNLEQEGYVVNTALDGITAVKMAQEVNPDLILLDIMMPQQDGVETCRQIRAIPKLADTYILFLTARSEEYSEIAAFDSGADDYITKPIKPRALMSRLSALFRRNNEKKIEESLIKIADLEIDKASYIVRRNEIEYQLPKKEFELLRFLAENPNKIYNRDDLLKNIWGTDVYVLARTVDVHIRKIREKLGSDHIVTVKGVGYKFVID